MQMDNATARVDSLLELTARLTDLIETETQHLQNHDTEPLAAIGAEKTKVAAIYTREMAALKSDVEATKSVEKGMLDRLKTETTQFRSVMNVHEKTLLRLRHVSEGMIKAIADESSKKKAAPDGYGDNALMAKKKTRPTSLAVNQVV
jgi:hypothetical protein